MDDHMNPLRHTMCCIKSTRHYGLQLYPSSITSLIAYTKCELGRVTHTKQSTSSIVSLLVTTCFHGLSNVNSHYLTLVLKLNTEVLLIQFLCLVEYVLLELHCPIPKTTLIYCDNLCDIPLQKPSLAPKHGPYQNRHSFCSEKE